MQNPLAAFAVLVLLASAQGNAQVTQPATAPAPASAATAPAAAAPALHLFLGPDSNACGITPLPKARKAGLIVWLHGGMRSQNRGKGLEAHRALLDFVRPGAYYLCSPSAFGGEEWLTPQGLAHIDALIDYMLAHYPIDAKDINMVGVSDGSLGVIAYTLQGKRELHRRMLISSFPQLVVPPESLPGQARFATGTWDFFQGGHDRLFPADQAVPYLQQWEKTYPNAHLHYFPDGEHDYSYYAANALDELKSVFSQEKGRKAAAGKTIKAQAIQNSAQKN